MNPTNALLAAIIAIVNADASMRTLFGRTSGLIRPDSPDLLDGPVPVCTYQVGLSRELTSDTWRITVSFTVYASERAIAASATATLAELLDNPAFALQGVDAAQDPENIPDFGEGDADTDPSDIARERADVTLTFLVTP